MPVLELERRDTGTPNQRVDLTKKTHPLIPPSERDKDGARGWIIMRSYPKGPPTLVYQVGMEVHPNGKERIRYLSGVDVHDQLSNSYGDPFIGFLNKRERRVYEYTFGAHGQPEVRHPETEIWNRHKFMDPRQYSAVESRIAKEKKLKVMINNQYALAS